LDLQKRASTFKKKKHLKQMGYSPVMVDFPTSRFTTIIPSNPKGACRKARRAAACSWAFKAKESPQEKYGRYNEL